LNVSNQPRDLLLLNVGFVIHESIGYFRDFPFAEPHISLPPDLELDDFKGIVRVTRTAQGLLLQARFSAYLTTECSRCLTEYPQPLPIEFTELYAFSAASATEEGLLVPESGKIDLSVPVREEMLVSLPMSTVCRPDCKGLCPICGGNLNEEICHHEEPIDPRLEVLKALLERAEDAAAGDADATD
jgi:uncharacterized protein